MSFSKLSARTAILAILQLAANAADTNSISPAAATDAEKIFGLSFSDSKIEMLLPGLKEQLAHFETIRARGLLNSVPPSMIFNPIPVGTKIAAGPNHFKPAKPPKIHLPTNRDDLAFLSIAELGSLIKSRQITSEALAIFFLDRLKKFGPTLQCTVTLTEELALRQARQADAEIAHGKYRGPLHGIPYGAKDLLAVKGIPTTWGAAPYTNQVFDNDATVIKRLEAAGAVLIVKTTLGELAMGDVWFGGKTKNPWNPAQGSSGSSAGSASATAAGLIPFGIGSETYGSIVSPSDRCGVTGFRPSYGRVSRAGAMALSWSMDKLGPLCRTVEDCAIVLNAICGPDELDQTVYDIPFNYDHRIDFKKIRVGYLAADFKGETGDRASNDDATLAKLRELGANLIPVTFPDYPLSAISVVLTTEAAAAFDDLTRTGRDDLLKQQNSGAWPNAFREKRFVPAVEYLQAQRLRYLLIQDTAKVFKDVDVIVAPSQAGSSLLLGNLTGLPCVVLPNGFSKNGTPTSICFLGNLFHDGEALAVAKAFQDATTFHKKHPPLTSSPP